MTILMLALVAYLVYVSYCKIVCLLFKGKQHNRFFGTFLSTVIPVVGSFPVIIMATKYEKMVKSPSSKFNEDILRYCIVGLSMVSVFMLFTPFFHSDAGNTDGINLIFGNEIAGSEILRPSVLMIYLVIAPFISAILTIADRKFNIRNVVSYCISLLLCLSMLAFFAVSSSEGISATILFWVYCAVNVTVMLLSIFSIVVVRNKQLQVIELQEKEEYIQSQIEKNKRPGEEPVESGTYKCAKCGNTVNKGEICECITSHRTLNSVMNEAAADEGSELCIHCKKVLAEGEKCDCAGDGFGITVKAQPYNERKCKYCGQRIVGESVCVCEKILKNSMPSDEPVVEKTADAEVDVESIIKDTSDELAELEKKINQKFSDIKNNF